MLVALAENMQGEERSWQPRPASQWLFSWLRLLRGEVEREELGQVAWLAGTVTLDSGAKAAAWPLCWKWRISMGCNLPCGQD